MVKVRLKFFYNLTIGQNSTKSFHSNIKIFPPVSSLMRGPGSSMGSMATNMGSLAGVGVGGCAMDPAKQHGIQFPLSQRRKRRVLFTQAQVGHKFYFQ